MTWRPSRASAGPWCSSTPDGSAGMHRPDHDGLAEHVRPAGASRTTARPVALALAGSHDPERPGGGQALPPTVALTDLLIGLRSTTRRRCEPDWRAAGDDPPPRTRLALAADGPVEIDLVRDGPHALVAGTTGSGKSELLRALVVGLAAGTRTGPPCVRARRLQGRRGVRRLRAPPARRRRRHGPRRAAGRARAAQPPRRAAASRSVAARGRRAGPEAVPDACLDGRRSPGWSSWWTSSPPSPPTCPGFVPSLVGVAQRGRSLGVHLVLATQRPAGAVSDDIRANTNIRIALRVQDPADSMDVVGEASAVAIPRHRPGRAVIRFGPGELVAVQVASVSLPRAEVPGVAVTVDDPDGPVAAGPPALDGLVTAIAAAARTSVLPPRPWLPPLPADLRCEDLPPGSSGVVDDPDHQTQRPWSWDRWKGHLLCIGAVGSGTTTALTSLTVPAAAATPPAGLHIYVVAADPTLRALDALPHIGSVITRTRTSAWPDSSPPRPAALADGRATAPHRRSSSSSTGWPRGGRSWPTGWAATWPTASTGCWSKARRAGIVVGGDGRSAGRRCRSPCPERWASDSSSASVTRRTRSCRAATGLGGRPAERSGRRRRLRPRRAGGGGRRPAGSGRCSRRPVGADRRARRPPPVDRLPERVAVEHLPGPRRVHRRPRRRGAADLVAADRPRRADPRRVPRGAARGRAPAGGRARSIRSLLRAAPASDRWSAPPTRPRPSSRPRRCTPARALLARARRCRSVTATLSAPAGRGRAADAHRRARRRRRAGRRPELGPAPTGQRVLALTVVAAGRVDALRSAYGHWTQVLRRQRRGLLLRPTSDLDGDVLGVTLPRREAVPAAPGRGYLVADGRCALVQLAWFDRAGNGTGGLGSPLVGRTDDDEGRVARSERATAGSSEPRSVARESGSASCASATSADRRPPRPSWRSSSTRPA